MRIDITMFSAVFPIDIYMLGVRARKELPFIVRHIDGNRNVLHAFAKKPDGSWLKA